jgi:ABC-2 type transport system permease protein
VDAALPYLAGLRSGVRRGAAARDELLVRVIFYGIILVIFAALWRAALNANGGELGGYDFKALFWYIAGAEAAVVSTKPRMIEEIGDEIGSGAVATALLRPVSYVGFRLSVEMGEALVRLLAMVTVAALLGTFLAGPPPTASGVALYAPMAVLAIACNLAAQHTFGGWAFWLQDAKGGWFLYQKLIFLLGGMLIPLELLPDALASVARLLPFAAMAYAPARALSGQDAAYLAAVQVAWLVVVLGVALSVFRAGERRLTLVGG